MAIALDAVTTNETHTASSATYAKTCTGSNLILVVALALFDSVLGERTVSGITYNSVALTKIRSQDVGSGERVELWYLINPSTGSNNVVITMGGTCSVIDSAAISLTGAKQSAQPDASNGVDSQSAEPNDITVTTVDDNCWIVGIIQWVNQSLGSPNGGQTQMINTHTGFIVGSYHGPVTPAGATTHGYTTGAADTACIVAASFSPAAITARPSSMALMGVGT